MKSISVQKVMETYRAAVAAQATDGQGAECLTIPELAMYSGGGLTDRSPHVDACGFCQRNLVSWARASGRPTLTTGRVHGAPVDQFLTTLWERFVELAGRRIRFEGEVLARKKADRSDSLRAVLRHGDEPSDYVQLVLEGGLRLTRNHFALKMRVDREPPLAPLAEGELAGFSLSLKGIERLVLGSVWLDTWSPPLLEWPLPPALVCSDGRERWLTAMGTNDEMVIPAHELEVGCVTVHRFRYPDLLDTIQQSVLGGLIPAESVTELDLLLSRVDSADEELHHWTAQWGVDEQVLSAMLTPIRQQGRAALLGTVKVVFRSGEEEELETAVEGGVSRSLEALLGTHGGQAVDAISEHIQWGSGDSLVAAYVLKWLGRVNDPITHDRRLAVLADCLRSRSPRLRDAAALGLDSLDDPRAISYLREAVRHEHVAELREDMGSVLKSLERTRRADDPPQN